jgi:hypothetical protein
MGSKAGWIVAGGLVVVIVVVALVNLWPKFFPPGPEAAPPVKPNITQEMLRKHDVTMPPVDVLGPGGAQNAPGEAGEEYDKAVKCFKENMKVIIPVQNVVDPNIDPNNRVEPDSAGLDALKKIDEFVAADCLKKSMNYTRMRIGDKFHFASRFDDKNDPADDLAEVGKGLQLLGQYYINKKQHADAERVLQHQFLLGWHMMQERARRSMVQSGMGLQKMALPMLADVYRKLPGDPATRIATLNRYNDKELTALIDFFDQPGTKHKADYLYVPGRGPQPQDLFLIVEKDEDRVWRVEALIALGLIRFTQEKDAAIQAKVNELLDKTWADPIEAAAAKSAKTATRGEFQRFHR